MEDKYSDILQQTHTDLKVGDANVPFEVELSTRHDDEKGGVLYEVPTHLKVGDAMGTSNFNYT